MCEIDNCNPYIYLLELHIGDGYFDRQSIGEYTVLINYSFHKSLLIKEKERGDDRLVKFRQGRSVIFAIAKPNDQLKINFQAYDDNEEIGNSNIYFLGIGAPNSLAEKSNKSPIASGIRTNVQLSHSAGSLQIFARLTCFGHRLLTEFSVSSDINTEFDEYVNDIELSAAESFTRCQFDIGYVNDVKLDMDNVIINQNVTIKDEQKQNIDNENLENINHIVNDIIDNGLKQFNLSQNITIDSEKIEEDNKETLNLPTIEEENIGDTLKILEIDKQDDIKDKFKPDKDGDISTDSDRNGTN